LRPDRFNLITGNCGCGKSTFVARGLIEKYREAFGVQLEEREVMVVTSRAVTRAQFANDNDNVEELDIRDEDLLSYFNDGDDAGLEELHASKIPIMTYDRFIHLVFGRKKKYGKKVLSHIKVFVFDECQALMVDRYIHGMEYLCTWVQERVVSGEDTYFIGITATPAPFLYVNEATVNMPVNVVNEEVLVPYKAAHVICTDFPGALEMLRTHELPGKNIFMTTKKDECGIVYQLVPDSAIVIGVNNKDAQIQCERNLKTRQDRDSPFDVVYQKYMDYIRGVIIDSGRIPDSVSTMNTLLKKQSVRNVNTLVTTSTLREGFTLREGSGVRNVFVLGTDDLNIPQFLGRARYNVDNLVVVRPSVVYGDQLMREYYMRSLWEFDDFVAGKDDSWFVNMESLFSCGPDDVEVRPELFEKDESNARLQKMVDRVLVWSLIPQVMKYLSTDEHEVCLYGENSKALVDAAYKANIIYGKSRHSYSIKSVAKAFESAGCRVKKKVPYRMDGKRRVGTVIYAPKDYKEE